MTGGKDTEPVRRIIALVLQWGGWISCIGIFAYATTYFDPNHGHFAPQWVGFGFILSMGIGIAGTLVRSRMRLTQTIVDAFKAGQQNERDQETGRKAARDERQAAHRCDHK